MLKFGTLRKKTSKEDIGEWKEAKAPSGKVYYYHTKTKQTSWTKPMEIIEAEPSSSTVSLVEDSLNEIISETPANLVQENNQDPQTQDASQILPQSQEEKNFSSNPPVKRAPSSEERVGIKQANINFIASVKLSTNAKGLQLNSLIQNIIFKLIVSRRLQLTCSRSLLQENKRKLTQMGTVQKDLAEIAELLKEIPENCYLEDIQAQVKSTYQKLCQTIENFKNIISEGIQETDNNQMITHFTSYSNVGVDILYIILELLKINDEIFQNDIIDLCRSILLILKGARDATSVHQLPG